MATGKRPDPKRRKTAHPHASFLATKCGEKHPAYKAGEMYGCYTHRTFAAQPCCADITGGALECPYCLSGLDADWRGYVPLWDRDWALWYVLIGEAYFESVDVIPFHATVEVSRARNPISPLVVRQEQTMLRQLPARSPWKDDVNMLAICLTLWKCAPLTKWVEDNRPLASASASTASPAKPPVPKVTPYKAPRGGGTEEADYTATINRLTANAKSLKPSTNGDGKH